MNLRTIWVEFGPSVAFSCLGALVRRRNTTFLSLALKDFALTPTRPAARQPRA
ncbi:MAG TPA: hypothetical protein VGK67_32410 [Myxococcales bacterium]